MNEIEKFYSEVETCLDQPVYQNIVIGEFNAQLGPKSDYQKYFGKFTSRTWDQNETGELLADFADANKLFVTFTLFQKPPKKRWTFESINTNKSRHEIDFGLWIDRLIVMNVEFQSPLDIGSDHLPVRFTLNITIKKQRPQMMKYGRTQNVDILTTNHRRETLDHQWFADQEVRQDPTATKNMHQRCVEEQATTISLLRRDEQTSAEEKIHELSCKSDRIR